VYCVIRYIIIHGYMYYHPKPIEQDDEISPKTEHK